MTAIDRYEITPRAYTRLSPSTKLDAERRKDLMPRGNAATIHGWRCWFIRQGTNRNTALQRTVDAQHFTGRKPDAPLFGRWERGTECNH